MSATDSVPDLSDIELARTYSFVDDVPDKKADWGRQLWRLLRSKLEFERPRLLRDNGESEFIAERFTNYALTRLVARGMIVESKVAGLSEDARQQAFVDAVDDILDVDDLTKDRVVWLLDRVCARRRRKGGDLTPSQSKTIAAFAAQENHRCYICGQELSFAVRPHPQSPPAGSGQPDWRLFEIEHMFPQSKGGGRHRTNLAACCQSCNKLKDDFLSFVDLPLEHYTTSSDDTERVRRVFGPKGRFALLWRQRGKCATCDTPFHDARSETLVLQKRDADDAYHFMNAQIICGDCSAATSSDKMSEVTFRE